MENSGHVGSRENWLSRSVLFREFIKFFSTCVAKCARSSAGPCNINAPTIGRESEARLIRLKINYQSVECSCELN